MDIETFKQTIVPMRKLLVSRARAMTGDDSQAEDLVQEVLLKMWDRRTEMAQHPNPVALCPCRKQHGVSLQMQRYAKKCNSLPIWFKI